MHAGTGKRLTIGSSGCVAVNALTKLNISRIDETIIENHTTRAGGTGYPSKRFCSSVRLCLGK